MAYSDRDYDDAIMAYIAAYTAANGTTCPRVSRAGQFIFVGHRDGTETTFRMKRFRAATERLLQRAAPTPPEGSRAGVRGVE